MAASATVGILRVLLSADSADFQAGVAKAASATQQFTKDLKTAGTQSEAVSAAMGKAFTKAEEGTRGLSKAVASLIGFDAIEKANTYAKAVEAIGGVSKLTAVEQGKVNSIVSEATAKYAALGREAPAALTALAAATKPAQDETFKLARFMGDLGTQVKASALGFISAQAVIGLVGGGFRSLSAFVGESVKAYAEQESALKKVTTALEAQGQATPAVIQGYAAMASQFQKTTVNSDELISEMQALLVQVGDVMPKDMEKALTAATDLSSGLGIDLRTATLLVGKAFEGETGTLKRYGIVIDEAKLKTEGASAVLDAIQQKFGGQAQAEIETYAGKVKQLANSWNEVQEAVGKQIVTDPVIIELLHQVKGSIDETSASADSGGHFVTEWWAQLLGGQAAIQAEIQLSKVLKLLQDADAMAAKLAAGAKSRAPTDLFKGGFGETGGSGILGADTQKFFEQYTAGMEAAAEADKKAAADAEAHAKAIRSLIDAFSGATAIKAAADAMEALAATQREGVTIAMMTRAEQDKVNGILQAAIDAYKALHREAPAALIAAYNATLDLVKLNKPLNDLADGFRKFFDARAQDQFKKLQAGAHESAIAIAELPKTMTALDDQFTKFFNKRFENDYKRLSGIAHDSAVQMIRDARESSDAWEHFGESIQRIGQNIGGSFGAFTSAGGGIVSGIGQMMKANDQWNANVAHTTSEVAAHYGLVIDQIIGLARLAIDIFGSGGLLDKLTGHDLDKTLTGPLHAFLEQQGGRLAVQARGIQAGFDTTLLLTTDSAKTFQTEMQRFNEAVAKSDALLGRYGLTWKDLGDTIQQANIDQQTRQLILDFRALGQSGVDVTKRITAMSGGLSQLVIDAVETGQKIPAALQPMLETLIRSGKLSEEAARALLGMSGQAVVAFKDVEAAAGRYGIKVEQLGKAVNQLRINDIAKQIIDDWTLLQSAGADTNTVLVGMQKSVQDLVTEALKAGFKIPEGMKPIIDAMIKAGLLIDANGDKLTDFGSLEFEKPLSQSIDELIDKLQDLIDAFSKVGTSAEEGFGRARGAAEATGTAVPRGSTGTGGGTATPTGGPSVPGTGPGPTSTPPTGTAGTGTSVPKRRYGTGGIIGRVLDFPSQSGADRVPIMAAEGEAILSAPAVSAIGREGFERMNRDWNGGAYGASSDSAAGGVAVTVSIAINNPTLQTESQIASLKRVLEDAVVDVLHRENATNARGVKTIVRRMVS